MPQMLEVTHVSKRGSSLRIKLLKMDGEKLWISPDDVLGFYEEGDIMMIQKMK